MSHGTKAFWYTVLAVVGVILAIFLITRIVSHTKSYKEKENPDSTAFWEKHTWGGYVFSYPPDWRLESSYEDSSGLLARKVETGFTLTPAGKEKHDAIFVGFGGDCTKMDTSVCVSPYPMYTNSRDASVLSTFTYIAKHVTPEDKS